MFQGSIPSAMRAILLQHIREWQITDLYVGCSGNLTIERMCCDNLPDLRLHGNDVSLYTSTLGLYAAGTPHEISVKEEVKEQYGWLEAYLKEPVDAVATIMLATRLLEGWGKQNAYYKRMQQAWKAQWPALHKATAEKVRKSTLKLASFFCGDIMEHIDRIPLDAGVVSFPPFWGGGYEKLYAPLEAVFDWPRPSYPMLELSGVMELFRKMAERRHWLFGTKERLEEWESFLRGICFTDGGGVPIFIYSNGGPVRLVTRQRQLEPALLNRLKEGMQLPEKGVLHVKQLKQPVFESLRAAYLNPGIIPGTPTAAYGVFVDEVMVGVFAVRIGGDTAAAYESMMEGPTAYMLTDFAVAPTSYPRLSKLVLMAALSREVQLIVERLANGRIRSLVTTAFSNRMESMKYRGVLKRLSRKKLGKGDVQDAFAYSLVYGAMAGQWSLAEAYAQWRKKHGKYETGASSEA